MNDIFSFRTSNYSSRIPNNVNRFRPNQVTFGSYSMKVMGPKISNSLPNELKSAENLKSVKNMIKQMAQPVNAITVNSMISAKSCPFMSSIFNLSI